MRTNLSKEFVFIRELLDKGDSHEIYKNLGRFERFYMAVNTQIKKFTNTGVNTICIASYDLAELVELTEPLIDKWSKQIKYTRMRRELWAPDEVNNETLNEWARKYTELFCVVAKIRCFLSIITYGSCYLEAFEKQDEQNNDLTTVVVNVIKNHMRDYY